MRSARLLLLVLLLLSPGISACGNQPAGIAAPDAQPLWDGGVGLGSGHREGTDSTETSTTTQAEAGGVGLGSGH